MSGDAGAELLAQILAAPDDDAPRMVYADYLIERGDPLGDFIRVQCRLAAEPDDARRRALRTAENKLLAAHGDAWRRPLAQLWPDDARWEPPAFDFMRGFVTRAKITTELLPRLDELFARAPLLRELELHAVVVDVLGPRLAGAFDSPRLRQIRALDVSALGGGDEAAHRIADAPALAGLERLRLRASWLGELVDGVVPRDALRTLFMGDAGAVALAASPHLRGVRHLALPDNRITSAGLHAIAHGAWRLESLDIGNNVLGARGDLAGALAGPALAGLRTLSLRRNALDPRVAALLAGGALLPALADLDLESCALGAAGSAAFCRALARPALRRLRLERNSLGDAGAIAIAGCAALATLTELEAGHNRIGQGGGAALATSPHLAGLERLTLNEPRWKPEMAGVFAASPTLARAKIYLKGRLLARAAPRKGRKPR